MEKVYKSHEIAYKRLKEKGATSWNEMYSTKKGETPDHVGLERSLFIEDILTKEWSPKIGNALEIGCGTGVFINWITSKGFKGAGIDISTTAIELAKQQNYKNVDFFEGDFCYSNVLENEKFDLIVDGNCFHCIVEDEDRKIFLEKAHSLLNENGVFMLNTMCSPINKKAFFEDNKTFKFKNHILYVPYNVELEGSKFFDGKLYMAQRKIEHWKNVLKAVKKAGFEIKMFKYEQGSVYSSVYLACKIKN